MDIALKNKRITRAKDVKLQDMDDARNRIDVCSLVMRDNSRLNQRLHADTKIDELLIRRDSLKNLELKSDRDILTPVRREKLVRRTDRVRIKPLQEPVRQKRELTRSKNPLIAGKKIISQLKKLDIEGKPFCLHKGNERSFIVQGRDFKWIVASIKIYKEILGMPKKEWGTLVNLERLGVKHDGIYVAAPLKGNAKEKAKMEVKEMCRDAVMKAGKILTIPFQLAATIADVLQHDPVLLVRFSGFKEGHLFVELGRWE